MGVARGGQRGFDTNLTVWLRGSACPREAPKGLSTSAPPRSCGRWGQGSPRSQRARPGGARMATQNDM